LLLAGQIIQPSKVFLSYTIILILCVQGPFVQVDELIRLLLNEPLPASTEVSDVVDTEKVAVKRKREPENEGEVGVVPPVNDLYRARQQKRVHT